MCFSFKHLLLYFSIKYKNESYIEYSLCIFCWFILAHISYSVACIPEGVYLSISWEQTIDN